MLECKLLICHLQTIRYYHDPLYSSLLCLKQAPSSQSLSSILEKFHLSYSPWWMCRPKFLCEVKTTQLLPSSKPAPPVLNPDLQPVCSVYSASGAVH